MKKTSITIAIPAFNEQDNIKKSVTLAFKVVAEMTPDFEVLVVDDGSRDRTASILRTLQKKYPELKIITHPVNLGIEPSLKDLYKAAKKELTFFNGADNEISMTILPDLLRKIDAGADIVVAKRVTKHYNLFREVQSWMFNFLIKLFFRFDPYDAGCAKLFKTNIYKKIKVDSNSVFGEAERLIKASKKGYKIASVKVTHYPNNKPSSIKLWSPFLAFKDLIWLLIRS